MPEPKDQRIVTMMTAQDVDAIDTWRFANRIASRSEAIRLLVQKALEQEKAK
jgi:Arc/MetJ-type ribon-helix-helix transcriptional regulator